MQLSQLQSWLGPLNFSYIRPLLRGYLFSNPDNVFVVVDVDICNPADPFSYSEYTREQNDLVSSSKKFFRFVVDDEEDLEGARARLELFMGGESEDVDVKIHGADRSRVAIDPTVPEAYFEEAFTEVYGRECLNMIYREYPVLDVLGETRWMDYVIFSREGMVCVEKNGVRFHHPLFIGKERYRAQLLKQNSIMGLGGKVYRWSLESMQFKDVFCEEIKAYLPAKEDIVQAHHVYAKREVKLFDHQEDVLKNIRRAREEGWKAFLVVLPTGTGKTHVVVCDHILNSGSYRMLVLVPSQKLKEQWIEYFRREQRTHQFSGSIGSSDEDDIMVVTYSWISRHYQEYSSDTFGYIVVDEAHHAVAPTLKKVISFFDPDTLIGLTATPERLDAKKLEDIFGEYETSLTLKEAIEKDVLSPIRAFRVKSNLDLSEIRYNGKDYVSTDLQKGVIVPSRDQLIVDVLKKYFVTSDMPFRSGIVFCVSVNHAISMAKRMQKHGISAMAISGSEKGSSKFIEQYQQGEIQFLCTCSLLTEGWDSPRTSIIVMARPTMSKVLYLQQLGRGTRKYPGKEALYVIDVVDNYGPLNVPWSCHAVFDISNYLPWGTLFESEEGYGQPVGEEVILAGLYEKERKIEKLNIFTFEKEYPDHLGVEELARELFISSGSLRSWVKKGKVVPDVSIPFGRQELYYFHPGRVDEIRQERGLKVHNEQTQYDDFFEFLEKGDYSYSYKMIFLLSMLKKVDHNGECNLDDLLNLYRRFYRMRIDAGLPVDRGNCPYSRPEFLEDRDTMKKNMLSNPFEKFERKRFMYHCKDLNNIAFSFSLWKQINDQQHFEKIRNKMLEDLENYYKELGGISNIEEIRNIW